MQYLKITLKYTSADIVSYALNFNVYNYDGPKNLTVQNDGTIFAMQWIQRVREGNF